MRASLSKSDNALSSLTSVVNGRFKRHHSIDDDYPVISSSSSSNDDRKLYIDSQTDHRVPLVSTETNNQQIVFEKSVFSSELVVRTFRTRIHLFRLF